MAAPRLPGLASTLVFPLSWVGLELLFQKLGTPYGSWASLAYTQVGLLPVLQLASITGLSGIHFMMTWCAAVTAWAWQHRAAFSRVRAGVATCGAVLLALLAWGQWRILAAPAAGEPLVVTGLTPSATLGAELQDRLRAVSRSASANVSPSDAVLEAAARLNDDLLERTSHEAGARPDVILWSEHAARVMPTTQSGLVDRARAIAESFGVRLILGIGLWDPESVPSFENKVVILDEAGALVGTYFKARPIVGQEAGILGKGNDHIATMETARGRLAIVICHDLDFPDFMRQAGRREVDVIFAPSSDWEAITRLHARMAILRAVENGSSLVRPTADGLSIVVDPLGRVVASQLDRGEDGDVFRARVPVFRLPALYPVIGDGFAYACLVGLVFLLVSAWHRRALSAAGAVLLACTLLPSPASAQQSTLIPFQIDDQFDRPHADTDVRGRLLLVAGSDKNGSRYQAAWVEALRATVRERGAAQDVAIVEVADLRGVPFFVKGSVKKKFPARESAWVLMDWKGEFARAYRFEPGACNLLLFDRSGGLVHRAAGRDPDPRLLNALSARLETHLASRPGSDDASGRRRRPDPPGRPATEPRRLQASVRGAKLKRSNAVLYGDSPIFDSRPLPSLNR